jgi:hypothetical protein
MVSTRIELTNPHDSNQSIQLTFLFTAQPDIKDVIDAFDRDPRCTRMKDADNYRKILIQGLNTFGVPQLDHLEMYDRNGYNILVTSVGQEWRVSLMDRERSFSGHCLGNISVARQPVNDNRPAPKVGKTAVSSKAVKARHEDDYVPKGNKADTKKQKPAEPTKTVAKKPAKPVVF